MSLTGKIHSFESFGTVDGPGIRFVIFFQGCNFKCLYCHNPDTWNTSVGTEYTTSQIVKMSLRFMPYFKKSNGGVTVSGGEPLTQIDFLIELLKNLKSNGIHTAVDTNGYFNLDENNNFCTDDLAKINLLFNYTDLFLLDIKHINNHTHKYLAKKSNFSVLKFAKLLSDANIPVWIRHVLVPGLTDNIANIKELSSFIKTLSNVEKIEVLPFHKIGEYKWKELNIQYDLSNIEEPSLEKVNEISKILGSP